MNPRKDCPFCSGEAKLMKEKTEFTYRKEVFHVFAHFYKCNTCNEDFTTTETDTLTVLQAHNQYREKYSIPFVHEICKIREKYQLSATKMSEVLGLGVNGYGNYEKGEIPTPAIGNLISTAEDPKNFIQLLGKAKHYFSSNQYEEAVENIEHLIHKEELSHKKISQLNHFCAANSYTGYKSSNYNLISNLLIWIVSTCKPVHNNKLKINKLLFYTDFLHYKKTGYSITGLSYRAIQYGPVPTCYDNIFFHCGNENIITSKWERENSGSGRELFITECSIETNIFTKEEIDTIETVVDKFKDTPSWDLVDLSHEERAWKDLHAEKSIIDYQEYAFDLKAF